MEKDELKDMIVQGNGSVETLEYTDEDGTEHCFIVESKFKAGEDQYAALIEVDPAMFEEHEGSSLHHVDGEAHDHHRHEHDECCGHHHEHGEGGRHHHCHEHGEDGEEEVNIILAKIMEDENGEIDIQVPTDEEFEKAAAAYEALNEE